jgi:hypothetical protein
MNNLTGYITFSEFVSGVLLENREIDSLDFIQLLSQFNYAYPDVDVIEPDYDFMKISSVVEFDKTGNKIKIRDDLNYDSIVVDKNLTRSTVTDFLMNHTNNYVVEFLEKNAKKRVKA